MFSVIINTMDVHRSQKGQFSADLSTLIYGIIQGRCFLLWNDSVKYIMVRFDRIP